MKKMCNDKLLQDCFGTNNFIIIKLKKWLNGDPNFPVERNFEHHVRNVEWKHMNKDIISMPDKWEYPWFATWDLAFTVCEF